MLIRAAAQGNVTNVIELLSRGASVDTRDEDGDTPLNVAAYYGHAEVCEILIERGKAKINTKDEEGFTPLLSAALRGHIEVCNLLLKTGQANVKEASRSGHTPLLAAAQSGFTEVCEILMANGSNLEEREPDTQYNALHSAAMGGHHALLQLLLKEADVNSRDRIEATPLHMASQHGHLVCVISLLQAGADPLLPKRDGQLPIHHAAGRNHSEVVKILIEQGGCSPDQVRHTARQSLNHHFHHVSVLTSFLIAAKPKGWEDSTDVCRPRCS